MAEGLSPGGVNHLELGGVEVLAVMTTFAEVTRNKLLRFGPDRMFAGARAGRTLSQVSGLGSWVSSGLRCSRVARQVIEAWCRGIYLYIYFLCD